MSEQLTLGMVRPGDPETSHYAAARVAPHAANDRQRVLLELAQVYPGGLDDFELADRLNGQQTSLGKRRGELRDAGLVTRLVIDGKPIRRYNPGGSLVAVWTLTPAGVAEAERLRL